MSCARSIWLALAMASVVSLFTSSFVAWPADASLAPPVGPSGPAAAERMRVHAETNAVAATQLAVSAAPRRVGTADVLALSPWGVSALGSVVGGVAALLGRRFIV